MGHKVNGLAAAIALAATAPTIAQDAMNIDNAGNVGVGTATPSQPLHVWRDDGTAQILVEETNGVAAARTLFRLSNTGNTKFEINEAGSGDTWAFTSPGTDFRISLQGSGTVELRINADGDAFLAGVLSENSDREAKTGIEPVDVDSILTKVADLPIARWSYSESPNTHHIGPMAQDFRAAFGTGASDKALATMDSSGVALAAIQALQSRNQELEERVRQLETLVTRLLPEVAQQ